MELLVVGLLLSVMVARWAEARGRSGVWWFTVSAMVTPVIAGLLLLFLPNLKPDRGGQESDVDARAAPSPGKDSGS